MFRRCLLPAPPAALAGRYLRECGSCVGRSEWLLPRCAAHGLQLILWDHILYKRATGVSDSAHSAASNSAHSAHSHHNMQ